MSSCRATNAKEDGAPWEHQPCRDLRGLRTDSMGRGQILYFPDVPFVGEEGR
jgi:hypothetical protein